MSGRVRISLDLNNDKRNSEPSLTSTSLTPDETEKFLKRKKRRSITFEEIKPRTLVSSEKKKEETLEDEAKTTTSPMNRLTRAKRSLSIEALTSQIFKPQTDSPSSPTSSSPRSRDSATPPGSTTRKRRSSKRLSKGFNKEFGILTKDDSISKLECILHKEPETSTFRWTSERFTYPPWEKPDAESTTKPLIDRVCLNSDFNIEVPLSENTPADLSIFELERNTYFFKQLLNISDTVKHYYRKNSEMPVIMTISRDKNEQTSKVLIRTPQSDIRVLISKSTTAKMIKTLCKEFPDLLEEFEIFPIKTDIPRWNKELLSFEAKQISFQEKIGVFCVKPGQTTEDEFLSNETPSPEFKKFINFLGEEIELEGWQKFRGGLDTKENTTGHRSVYTTYKGFEIMFHISTMLPYNPNDPQQVCKKRHIGNDVVVIIFKENNTPFDPLCIRSHFNHVFFVIQPAMIAGKTHYAVEIATKPGVVPFAPYLTKPALYPMSEEFRAVLLAKLLNANRAAMYAPNFLQKYERTRKMMLNDYLKSVPIK